MSESREYTYLDELVERYPALAAVRKEISAVYEIIKTCYENGGKLLIAGNGGSCADAEHMVGELMKGFVKPRALAPELKNHLAKVHPELGPELAGKLQQALPAISLTGHPGLSTAFLNDVDGRLIYGQQVMGYGRPGDVFLGISTSGNAKNVMYGAVTARALGLKVAALTGKNGGALGAFADAAVVAPQWETYKIQELHLPIYHAICLMLEEYFFGEDGVRG